MFAISRLVAGTAAVLTLAACEPIPGASADAPAAAGAETPAAQTAATAGAVAMPAGLSSDERLIWNSLTPSAQQAAADYIASGGTLTQFVAI